MSDSTPDPAADAQRRPALVRFGIALVWCTAVAVALRTTAIVWLDWRVRGIALDLAMWRSAAEIGRLLAQSVLVGIGLALLVGATAGVRLGSRWLEYLLGAALAGLALATATWGWPLASRHYTYALREIAAPFPLGLTALGALVVTAVVFRRARLRSSPRLPALAAAVALGGAGPALLALGADDAEPTQVVRREVRELLFEADAWRVEEENPSHPPEIAVITPNRDYKFDGGDRPSLVMTPPAKVSFEVRPEDGPCVLRPAVGVDNAFPGPQWPAAKTIVLGAEVAIDGRPVWTETLSVGQSDPPKSRVWHYAADDGGIRVEPGMVITLRTWLEEPKKVRPRLISRIPIGFSGLMLEREERRALGRPTEREPNIVLIVMDTLRADRLSCYGWPQPTTPNIDELARRGTLYENAYSVSSWTWPATASILTGLYPETHGVVNDDACYLAPGLETLPEVLATRQYVTGAFSGNPLITAEKNFGQGLQTFDSRIEFRKTSDLMPLADAWIERHRLYRFFLYLHLVDPHSPHVPSPEALALVGDEPPPDYPGPNAIAEYNVKLLQGKGRDEGGALDVDAVIPPAHQEWMKELYTASVATADEYVGDLVEILRRHGILEDTVIVFTSDHGEELLDHGFATHGQALWEELLRVPLVVAGPQVPRGERVSQRVSTRQLAPTLAALAGARFRGVDQGVDLLRIAEIPDEPLFFSTLHGWWNGVNLVPIYGVRVGDWVLHYAPTAKPWGRARDPDAPTGEVRLYDLASDPRQQRDVAAQEPERVERLRRTLLAHLKDAESRRPNVRVAAGSATLDMLKDIGYIGADDDPPAGGTAERPRDHDQ